MDAPLVEKFSGKKPFVTSMQEIRSLAIKAFFPEYCLLPVFYMIGYWHLWIAAYVAQAAFLTGSIFFQAQVYFSGRHEEVDDEIKEGYARMNKDMESIMRISVASLHIKVWFYNAVLLMPMFMHSVSSAVAIGASQAAWEVQPELQTTFLARWEDVPVFGGLVGPAGLPRTLVSMLVISLILHGMALVGVLRSSLRPDMIVPSLCEASNLLFLYKMFTPPQDGGEVPLVRFFIVPVIKVPMVWGKISLLSLTYDNLSSSGRVSMIIAILLGWYSFMPVIASMSESVYRRPCGLAVGIVPVGILVLGFIIMISHFVGIFVCPGTHDFSLMNLGCNPSQ